MKLTNERPFANPEATVRKLVEIAAGIEPVEDGRIHIELVNLPFLRMGGAGDQFRAASRWPASAAGWSCTSPGPASG